MIILGLPWLRQHNPDINWEKGTFEFRTDPMLVKIRAIATKAQAMMKGTPFVKQKPQRIKSLKPTIEEIADEEPHPITNPDAEPIGPQDYLSENKPVPNHPVKETPKPSKPQPEPETELKLVDLWCSSLSHHLICAVAKLKLEKFVTLA